MIGIAASSAATSDTSNVRSPQTGKWSKQLQPYYACLHPRHQRRIPEPAGAPTAYASQLPPVGAGVCGTDCLTWVIQVTQRRKLGTTQVARAMVFMEVERVAERQPAVAGESCEDQ